MAWADLVNYMNLMYVDTFYGEKLIIFIKGTLIRSWQVWLSETLLLRVIQSQG